MVLRGLPTAETLDINGEKKQLQKARATLVAGVGGGGGWGGGTRDTGFSVMGVLGDMVGGG